MRAVDRVSAGAARGVKPVLRWGLGHALPKVLLRLAASRGDLHGRLVMETAGGSCDTTTSLFAEIRASAPLHRSAYAYVTARHDVVKEILASPDLRTGFEIDEATRIGRLQRWANADAPRGPLTPPSLLVIEPPEHSRYRKLVTRVFTARAVEDLRSRTQAVAEGLLDELEAQSAGPQDLVSTYCSLLPVTVIAEILGVPESDRARVLALGAAAAPSLDLGISFAQFRDVERALTEFDTWLGGHLDRLRDRPGQDLMSRLVAARDEDGGLGDAALRSTAGLVLAAGFETTVNLLGNGIFLLSRHQDQLGAVRADDSLWPNAVEEVLRLDPPVLLTGRVAARDTEVGGSPVRAAGVCVALLAAANRDPEVFSDPESFDVERANAREHLSFSAGRHFCLGAALARMEGEVGLRTLFTRFPDLSVEPGAVRRNTRILRGFSTLPVTLRR